MSQAFELTTKERLQKTKQAAARTRKNIYYIPKAPCTCFFLFGFPLKIKQNVTQDRHVAVVW